MSLEQLKAFLAKVKDDSNLQEKLKAAKSPEGVVGIAKEQGYEFTADKINQLSEEELEGTAGGGCYDNTNECSTMTIVVLQGEGDKR
ncbi:nif11-like leader peptide domain protein [Synechococcus sp. BIOS-E4-1]|uniref:Nif11-like leader peptide family natural product precursor n=1 Tax=Synechococcus sp. BIOS-E4-1 TaxID=1400864 RepID=UPI001647F597|nr:Nif11-like leader peptide family natural product precursor [Synechococcus sp. BIOS-E4-1]QNI55212.1 nif11-like leader peptide domain protein [Synechococcus sp. BIOS-E4-1]